MAKRLDERAWIGAGPAGPPAPAWWAVSLLLVAVAILLRAPILPRLPSASFDPAWMAVLLQAWLDDAVFGREVVFNSGALNVFYTALYHPATYPWVLLYGVAVCGASLFAACLLLRRQPLAWLLALGLAALLPLPMLWNASLMLSPFLIPPLWASSGRLARGLAIFLLLLAAVGGFAKFSAFLGAAMVLPATDLLLLWRQRRWPLLTPLFALAVVAVQLLLGQPLAALGDFIATSLAFAGGYASDHALSGPAGWAWQERAAFLLLAGSLLALAAVAWFRARGDLPRGVGALALLSLSAGLFALWKTGFVRHDVHALSAWSGVPLLAVVALAPLRPGRLTKCAVLFLLLACTVLQLKSVAVHRLRSDDLSAAVERTLAETRDRLAVIAGLLGDPATRLAEWEAQVEAARAETAARYDLPALEGRVGVVAGPPYPALASGLSLDQHPTVYGYVANRPELLDANRRHLESGGRPDWLLWGFYPLDRRYPSINDGNLWPTVLTHYELAGETADFLLMRRRAEPLPLERSKVAIKGLEPGTWVWIAPDERPLWAVLRLQPSLLGKAMALLWRPPLLTLEVGFQGGGTARYVLPRHAAGAGFLLSPLIDDLAALRRLADGSLAVGAELPRVRRLRLLVEPLGLPGLAARAYAFPARLRVVALGAAP